MPSDIIILQITKNIGTDHTLYQYNSEGRMNQATNSIGSIFFTYSDQGDPQVVSYPDGRSIYYGFNEDRQRSFTADNHGYNVTYQYNNKQQLVSIVCLSTQQPVAQFEYNSRGLLSRKVLGNGAFTTYAYVTDTAELLSVVNHYANGTVSSCFSYSYDSRGRIIGITTNEGNWTYSYDPAGQMVQWINPEGDTTTYTYDGRSNRVVSSVNGRLSGYETNNVNQYTSFNQSNHFFYDANGNLIKKISGEQNVTFVFDAEGKLIQSNAPRKRYIMHATMYHCKANFFTYVQLLILL